MRTTQLTSIESKNAVMTCSPRPNLLSLPFEILEIIFQHLGVVDLCHLALCSRLCRRVVNQDYLWSPLCRTRGWERFGTVADLRKEIPYNCSSDGQCTARDRAGHEKISFPTDSIVTAGNQGGLDCTCKWKEVYMKALHLENNWTNARTHAISIILDVEGFRVGEVQTLDSDGDCLVYGLPGEMVQVWNSKKGTCQHIIKVPVCYKGMKVKNDMIVVGCVDKVIRTFSVKTGEALRVFQQQTKDPVQFKAGLQVPQMTVFFDGDTVVSRVLHSNCIRVWSAVDGVCRHTLRVSKEDELADVKFQDKMVAAAYSDDCIRLWDAGTGVCVHIFRMNNTFRSYRGYQQFHLGTGIIVFANVDYTGMKLTVRSTDSGECIKSFHTEDNHHGKGHAYELHLVGELLVVNAWHCVLAYNTGGKMLTKFLYDTKRAVKVSGSVCCIADYSTERGDRYMQLFKATEFGLVPICTMHQPYWSLSYFWTDATKVILRGDPEPAMCCMHCW